MHGVKIAGMEPPRPPPRHRGCILPTDRVEVSYRFTVPLPFETVMMGKTWTFFIWQASYPPHFGVAMRRSDWLPSQCSFLERCDSLEAAVQASRSELRFSYPNELIGLFKQLMREGRAERVCGPHTRLFYRNIVLNELVHRRAEELRAQR
jgi:hypothetical protein